MPVLSLAADVGPEGPLVPCTTNCGWSNLITLVDNIIHFTLYYMVIPIAAIMFAYAGFLLVTAGGEVSRRSKAKSIFTNAVIGLVIAIAAWLIVRLILSTLGFTGPGLLNG